MFFANYILKDCLAKIKIQLRNIKVTTEEMRGDKSKAYAIVYDMKLAIQELYVATNDSNYLDTKDFLDLKLNDIKEADTPVKLIAELNILKDSLEQMDFIKEIYSNYNYRNYNSRKSINEDYIDIITKKIKSNRKFNIFDTSCGYGERLEIFRKNCSNALNYGLEENNSAAEDAKEFATKVIKGQLKGSRISNEAFDVLIAQPGIENDLAKNMSYGTILRREKEFLQNIYKYMAPEGVVIFAIPYYRLYKDICTIIAKQYKNVEIVKGFGEYDKDYGLNNVYIIGQKDSSKALDEDIYNKLRRCGDPKNIPSIFSVQFPEYNLHANYKEVDMFKGSVLDMEELYEIVETSGCYKNMLDKQKVEKIHENTKKPLLPFNVGQIGLVLTSGCLDGIVDEGDGHYHLVKGRVSKKTDTSRDMSDGILEEKEVISNRVEINVFLPNGEFKTLA